MSGEPVGWGTLLTPAEVAAIFNVDPKTVTSWSKAGKLSAVKTPGGHRRFPLSEVVELMARGSQQRTTPETVVLPVQPRSTADAHRPESVESLVMTGFDGTDEPSAAAAVVAEAVAVALEAQASIAAQEVVDVAEAVMAAARTAAVAAETAREARRAAAQLAAEDVARTAARTAARIQTLADAAAVHQAAAAAEAAGVVAAASWPGLKRRRLSSRSGWRPSSRPQP